MSVNVAAYVNWNDEAMHSAVHNSVQSFQCVPNTVSPISTPVYSPIIIHI